RLAKANGLISATRPAMFAAGPMLAGIMAAVGGTAPGLRVNGGTVIAAALAVFVGAKAGALPTELRGQAGLIEEALHGLRFLVGERRLRDSTITAAGANVVFGFIEATFVVMASEVLLTQSDVEIGTLIVAFGLGAILGAAVADRVIRFLGLGRTMVIGVLVMAAGMGLLVFSRFGVMALVFAFSMFVGI